ncbi:hypothetical protein [Gordonia zhaorongruii]|uniref:hypothetical protein n=1 Tax=Gordonia zhaorongruii TaxID=2597659 RepID=UPI001045A00F|nr:hypothetical protein [Gordonia zhaorongruii]
MSVSVTPLELGMFETLPSHTRRCVFWEMDRDDNGDGFGAMIDARSGSSNESEFDKEAWISGVLLEWGTCGQVAIESSTGRVVGSAFYAPPGRVPRAHRFPTAPVAADAVLLTRVRVEPGFEPIAVSLLDAVIGDVVRRGVRAVEAFGFSGAREPLEQDLVGLLLGDGSPADVCQKCLMSTQFLVDSGFEVVASDQFLPRLRLELDEGLGWKSEVERALDKLVQEATAELESSGASAR